MAERPEDLNLPNAVVTRIIKDAIPEGVNVSKEARQAISKAASVFVLYATSCSNNFALKAKRKTISAQDVISAMDDMEFEHFKVPLHQCLDAYRKEQQDKKEASEKKKKAKDQGNASMEDSADVIVISNGDREAEEENDIVIEDYESSSEENGETGEEG